MMEAVVFDLDDTLYSERDFVESGYKAVAHHIASGTGHRPEDVFRAMMNTLDASGRKAVLPAAISMFRNNSVPVPDLVEVYRNHTPRMRLPFGHDRLLRRLRQKYRLGIITDGIPAVQRRKIEALGLQGEVDSIIYTLEHGQEREKPDPLPFSVMLQTLQVRPSRALYVGDNPWKDCTGAHRAGMKFALVSVQGRNSQGANFGTDRPDFMIESLFQLPRILRSADRNG